jgi:hypothetical protein
MGTARRKIHPSSRAGIAILGVVGIFVGGVLVAIVLSREFHLKREIDPLELLKVTLVGAAAFVWQQYYAQRDAMRQGERAQLLALLDEVIRHATETHKVFRVAEVGARGTVTMAARDQLVRAFDTLDSYIILLERMLYDCDCSSNEDIFIAANEGYNDTVMRNGLNAPVTSRPRAEESYRQLHLALWRTRLRVVRL